VDVGDLVVDVRECRSNAGVVAVTLLLVAQHDAAVEPYATHIVPAQEGLVTARFAEVPPGRYAVSVMHDEDGDGELDVGPGGLPLEGVGFTHDPAVDAGSPDPSDVAFSHGRGESLVRVTLNYLS